MKRITKTLKKFFSRHYLAIIIIGTTFTLWFSYFYIDRKIHGVWFFSRKLSAEEIAMYLLFMLLGSFVISGGFISDKRRIRRLAELDNLRKMNLIDSIAMKIFKEPSFEKKIEIAIESLKEIVPVKEICVITEQDGKPFIYFSTKRCDICKFVREGKSLNESLDKYEGKFYKGFFVLKINLYSSTSYYTLVKTSHPLTNSEKELIVRYKKTIEPLFINARLMIELKESKNRVEKLLGRYKALHNLLLKLQNASTPEEIFWSISRSTILFFDAKSAYVMDVSERENPDIIAVKNVPEKFIKVLRHCLNTKGWYWKIITDTMRGKKVLYIRDVAKDSNVQSEFSNFARSWMGIPFVLDGRVVAILGINGELPNKFSPEDIVFANMLSDMVSSILVKIRYLEKLDQYSITDSLTGLYNKREFYRRIFEETRKSAMFGRKLSVAVFDLDGFKEWNDTYGHLEGDNLLRKLGNALKKRLRASDTAFRFGGDEFIILMPNTSKESAKKVMSDILFITRELTTGKQVKITISAGIAEYNPNESVEEFIERADEALYKAKKEGKNRIEIAV